MKNTLSVDWLQLHVSVPCSDYENYFARQKSKNFSVVTDNGTETEPDAYTVERESLQTRNFSAIYSIKDDKGDEVAVLAASPRNTMCMKEDSGLLKITNRFLYQKALYNFVRKLLKELGLKFINITRLDIAYDFLKFDTMECKDFIYSVLDETFLKSHQSTIKVMGDTVSVDRGKKTRGFSSLKFGKETSDVCYYLYNKTLELIQVKHKPWIHDHWRSVGWDGEANVYRLEFSLKPDTKGIFTEDGEQFTFKSLDMILNIESIYKHFFNKCFNFVCAEKTKRGNWKKQSRCTPVVLFEELKFTSVQIELSEKKDSGRSDKVFLKALKQLNDELRGVNHELGLVGNELITYICCSRDLKGWAEKKLGINVDHFSDTVLLADAKKKQIELYSALCYQHSDLHALGKLHQLSMTF